MADTDNEFLDNGQENEAEAYVLRLFITGATPNSIRAVENLRAVCEQYLLGQYNLEVIDVHQQPDLARSEDLIALPMLIKEAPGTRRRLIGDMSNTAKVLKGLDLPQTD